MIISDDNVAKLYANEFYIMMLSIKPDTILLKFPPGEGSKSREVKTSLEDRLIELGVSRRDLLVGFGGGVVTDMVGYLAATYLRGMSYVAIPTTLMGMVDAAIGGKNGVNHSKGKNLMGSLHSPEDVYIVTAFLETLPNEVFREGFVEIIKYGLIWDNQFFASLEQRKLDREQFIARSIQIKRKIVKLDPSDSGLRRILNFGHLIAHAIEKSTNYTVSHGKSLWLGLLIESYISHIKGYLGRGDLDRIVSFLLADDIRFDRIPNLLPEKLFEVMKLDKKASPRGPRVVLLKRIGKVVSFDGEYCTELDYRDFLEAFSWGVNLMEKPRLIRSLTD